MVKFYYLCTVVLFLVISSCNNDAKQHNQTRNYSSSCYTWVVDNEELKDQIYKFHYTAEPIDLTNKLVIVYYYAQDDLECYRLTHMLGAYSLSRSSIHLLVEVNGILVGVVFEGASAFNLSEQSLVEIMKNVFPRGYEYYERQLELNERDQFAATYSTQESLFPPPVTGSSETWVLKFKNGEMIDKKIEK